MHKVIMLTMWKMNCSIIVSHTILKKRSGGLKLVLEYEKKDPHKFLLTRIKYVVPTEAKPEILSLCISNV